MSFLGGFEEEEEEEGGGGGGDEEEDEDDDEGEEVQEEDAPNPRDITISSPLLLLFRVTSFPSIFKAPTKTSLNCFLLLLLLLKS
jgi:hypothetical protein